MNCTNNRQVSITQPEKNDTYFVIPRRVCVELLSRSIRCGAENPLRFFQWCRIGVRLHCRSQLRDPESWHFPRRSPETFSRSPSPLIQRKRKKPVNRNRIMDEAGIFTFQWFENEKLSAKDFLFFFQFLLRTSVKFLQVVLQCCLILYKSLFTKLVVAQKRKTYIHNNNTVKSNKTKQNTASKYATLLLYAIMQ